MKYAKQKAEAEKANAMLEMQADQQRRQAMEIDARRRMLQTVRTAQQAQSSALAASVNQGGQFSSGLAGGRATVSGEAATSELGISQNLQIGEKLFDINSQIDINKLSIADIESKSSQAQGISSAMTGIGKGLMSF